ncbi:MAG TPA: SLC13 family permease [Candidatus Krumholzibacteria bacterium]|nr:SLC13 family permease [Candidatus Krumholzibacteria bacterium]HRX51785.1 SLC13 family permease [Candidatus Krumholzibacteria bacterium]
MTETQPRILIVDDDPDFRAALAARLRSRDFHVQEAADAASGVRAVRGDRDLDAVLLDLRLPDQPGERALVEMKRLRPEVPVLVLTGYGSIETAMATGSAGAYRYFEKPAEFEDLVAALHDARREKRHALARADVPLARKGAGVWRRLIGVPNSRPLVMIAGLLLLLGAAWLPPSERLTDLLSQPRGSQGPPEIGRLDVTGYVDYHKMAEGQSIAQYFSATAQPTGLPDGGRAGKGDPLPVREAARKAHMMIALIVMAALFWATSAMPVGITALVVAVVMYASGVMAPDKIVQAFAKDSVLFIFGILVLSRVIMGTGLDRRIGLLLLAPVRNLPLLLFVFLPVFSLTCSFISETVLVAFMMPLFLMVHSRMSEQHREGDGLRPLLVMFALMICFAANLGGPGSPAAGGRNAVMVGILSDYGVAPSFLEWMRYGLPFVPVAALAVGMYFFLAFRSRLKVRSLDVAAVVRRESDRIGPMTRDEYVSAAVLLGVVVLWVTASGRLGMGGPPVLGLVALNVLGIMKWTEVAKIHWEVVFLYAGASAIGKGLALTGGAMYLADGIVQLMPDAWLQGAGLPIVASLITGTVTNFMSDGATVASLGPVTVPMSLSGGLHPWAVGFATAFASSFAHLLIIGTPSNALVYAMSKDPLTGRQLVTQRDFLIHGLAALVISFGVLWFWTFLGYWRWVGFPEA